MIVFLGIIVLVGYAFVTVLIYDVLKGGESLDAFSTGLSVLWPLLLFIMLWLNGPSWCRSLWRKFKWK